MIIFPAIDIKDGKCVRLYQGEFSTSSVVREDPVSTALEFKEQGAEYLHMVDLNGALKGNSRNGNIISKVLEKAGIPVQLGGGIRDMEAIERLLEKGVTRVILGTAALNNPSLVKEAVKRFGDKIAVGIDSRNGCVAVDGWTSVSRVDCMDFASMMEQAGVSTIIFTDISRDGTLKGPNFTLTQSINEKVSCDVIASGGIKSIEDIKTLKDMGLYGAIAGKAIYSRTLSLKEAIYAGRGENIAD